MGTKGQRLIDTTKLYEFLDGSSRESEFMQLLSSSYNDIYYSVLSIVGNRVDAEDVIQDVCVLLWEKFHEFEQGTNFRKWACAFAFNVAKSHVRQNRRRRGYGLSDDILQKISRLQSAGSELFELRRELLETCLAKLATKDHRFLFQCYSSRISLVEHARRENLPISSVYTRLKRLRKQLLDCISRQIGRET